MSNYIINNDTVDVLSENYLYGMIKLLKDLLKNILIKNSAIQLNIKTHIFDLSTYKK